MSYRDQLIELFAGNGIDPAQAFEDDTSLIKSGLIDSMGLFNLVVWIEEKVGSKIDFTDIDIPKEWDTIADILNFVGKHRDPRTAG